MTDYREILNAAQSLKAADRRELVVALWETLEGDELAPPSDEWIAETRKRSAERDAGQMSVARWPEVRDRTRRRAGLE